MHAYMRDFWESGVHAVHNVQDPWKGRPMKAHRNRCTARISDGSRQCERWAINGSTVCATHGGRAPQVKKSARERLLEAADPAAVRLVKALESADERAAIKAAQLILDRAGLGPKSAVEMSGPDGKPIQHQEETQWFEYCTLEEKVMIRDIAQRAIERMNAIDS